MPVFVLLLVAGWLIYANWGRIFKNTSEPPAPPPRPSVVQQANRLHLDGNTTDAIAMLEQVAEGSPDYDGAQLLVGRWREELAQAEATTVTDSGPAAVKLVFLGTDTTAVP